MENQNLPKEEAVFRIFEGLCESFLAALQKKDLLQASTMLMKLAVVFFSSVFMTTGKPEEGLEALLLDMRNGIHKHILHLTSKWN